MALQTRNQPWIAFECVDGSRGSNQACEPKREVPEMSPSVDNRPAHGCISVNQMLYHWVICTEEHHGLKRIVSIDRECEPTARSVDHAFRQESMAQPPGHAQPSVDPDMAGDPAPCNKGNGKATW